LDKKWITSQQRILNFIGKERPAQYQIGARCQCGYSGLGIGDRYGKG
jgi:hypothetical protein